MSNQADYEWEDRDDINELDCPRCLQPTDGVFRVWAQPCGHKVEPEWISSALRKARETGTLQIGALLRGTDETPIA